jgi:adenylate cyclase
MLTAFNLSPQKGCMMKDQLTEDSPSFQKAVTHHVESILKSQDFKATPKDITFLKFIVNQALTGKGRKINGYTVATEVFGRGPDFNVITDPIVSIQADILRRKLARYYQNTGKNDPIRIYIPNGTYVPVFKKRKMHEK